MAAVNAVNNLQLPQTSAYGASQGLMSTDGLQGQAPQANLSMNYAPSAPNMWS